MMELPALPRLPPPPWMWGRDVSGSDLDYLVAIKERELASRGIPPGLSKRAVRWAQEYAQGLTTMMAAPASESPIIYRRALIYGLTKAEDWARGILRAIDV